MGPRLPAGRPGDEREEKVVHDRGDPFVGYPLQRHQHVVPQQVERHLQDGGGELVQVDLAALVGTAESSPVPAAAGSGKIDV
jgi:hypothetical protein